MVFVCCIHNLSMADIREDKRRGKVRGDKGQ